MSKSREGEAKKVENFYSTIEHNSDSIIVTILTPEFVLKPESRKLPPPSLYLEMRVSIIIESHISRMEQG